MKRFFGKRFSLAEVAGLLAVGLVGVAFYAVLVRAQRSRRRGAARPA